MTSDTMLFQSTPSTTSLMLPAAPSVKLRPPKNVGLQFVSVIAHIMPASSGQINFGTPPTTHLEIYGGVLFAVVTVVKQRDGPRRLRDFDDDRAHATWHN